jgi:hypothetical protein
VNAPRSSGPLRSVPPSMRATGDRPPSAWTLAWASVLSPEGANGYRFAGGQSVSSAVSFMPAPDDRRKRERRDRAPLSCDGGRRMIERVGLYHSVREGHCRWLSVAPPFRAPSQRRFRAGALAGSTSPLEFAHQRQRHRTGVAQAVPGDKRTLGGESIAEQGAPPAGSGLHRVARADRFKPPGLPADA